MPELVTCDWHGTNPHGQIDACRNPQPVYRLENETLAEAAAHVRDHPELLSPAEDYADAHSEVRAHGAALASRLAQAVPKEPEPTELAPEVVAVTEAHRAWTDSRQVLREAVRAARAAGISWGEMAAACQVKRSTVERWL